MDNKLQDNLQDNLSNLDDEILDLNIDPVTELNDSSSEDAMQQYFKNISAYKPYNHEEEMELGRRIQQGDKDALKKLILANLKFVVSIANKYKTQDVPLLDLINQGNIGLLEAGLSTAVVQALYAPVASNNKEEISSIIQQYVIREIKKVLDKYKSITTEEIRGVEKLINSISNKELKEEFLNDWSMSVKIAKEIGENEVDDRIISLQ